MLEQFTVATIKKSAKTLGLNMEYTSTSLETRSKKDLEGLVLQFSYLFYSLQKLEASHGLYS